MLLTQSNNYHGSSQRHLPGSLDRGCLKIECYLTLAKTTPGIILTISGSTSEYKLILTSFSNNHQNVPFTLNEITLPEPLH